jgi:hypothetical protein
MLATILFRESSHLLSKNLKPKIYKTIILPVVLNWCETSPVTLREEHRLRVFENRVLRRIFGPKKEVVAGGWRRLHNEELQNFYASPNVILVIKLRMRWVRHVASMGEMRNAYNILFGNPKGKRSFGRPRHRWQDIKMDHREIGLDGVE